MPGDDPEYSPKAVLLFSGKRKSGKDFLTEELLRLLSSAGIDATVVRLSAPLKKCYADDNGLDYQQLMSASDYKEKHRLDMIKWSEEIRNKDYGYFCRASLSFHSAEKHPVWIVSDCRRKTDLKFFEERFSPRCRRVRVTASQATRERRGFEFQSGVDDAESECGIDGEEAHFTVANDDEGKKPEELLKEVTEEVLKLIAAQEETS